MRLFFIVFFFISLINARAQSGILQPDPNTPSLQKPVVFFIDSVKMGNAMNYLDFVDTKDIRDIKIHNEYGQGEIYVTLKHHNVLEDLIKDIKLSIQDIVNANVAIDKRKRPMLFLLDDKLITDTVNVRIPSRRLNHVVINEASEMAYFKTAFPGLLVLQIFTRPPVFRISITN